MIEEPRRRGGYWLVMDSFGLLLKKSIVSYIHTSKSMNEVVDLHV